MSLSWLQKKSLLWCMYGLPQPNSSPPLLGKDNSHKNRSEQGTSRAHPASQGKAVKEPSLSSLGRRAVPYKHSRVNNRRESTAKPK